MLASSCRFALLSLAAFCGQHILNASSVYSTSFENPPFTTGPIAGQDGWSVFGPGNPQVENGFALSGSQAVFVDGNVASQAGPFHSDSVPGSLIDLSADVAIFTSSIQTEWQFAALGPGLFPFIGGIDVFPDNSIEAITNGFPIIGAFPRATAFDAAAWHHVDFLFNMNSQTYNITIDGVTLATNLAFCGDNGPCAGAFVPAYGAGFLDSFGATSPGVNGGTPNDSAYMDNFSLASVPEPSTIFGGALALVVAGVIRLRRR